MSVFVAFVALVIQVANNNNSSSEIGLELSIG